MKKNNPAQIKTRLSQKADVPDTKKKLIRVSALSKADMQKRIIELETALQKQANEQIFQNEEKQKLADELLIANNEQGFQNKEKHKRADELVIANKELAFQNEEKLNRVDELANINKKLIDSKEKYRLQFESMIEGFCIIEMIFDKFGKAVDYRFLETNPAFEAQSGLYNALGKLMRDLAPNHEQYWYDHFGTVSLTGKPVQFESEAKQLNRWFKVHAFRLGDQENKQVGICFNDITKRKRAEIESVNSKALLLEAESTGKIGGWTFNVDTLEQKWTQGIFDILEFETTDEAPKVPDGIGFIDPEFQPMAILAMQRATEFGEPYKQEWKVITAKGNTRWVQAIGKAKQVNGKTVSLSGSFQDITESKQAKEEMLVLSEMLDASPASVTIHNFEGDFLWVNKKTLEYHGYSEDELKSIGVKGIDVPVSKEKFESRIKEITEHGEASFEVEHFRKDGTKFPLLVAAKIIKWQGIDAILSIASDITERKEADNIIREKITELERFQNLTVNRELAMIALKKEINELRKKKGEPIKYIINE